MAPEIVEPTTYAERFDALYPGWVYQIPGVVLTVAGFGGLAALSLF